MTVDGSIHATAIVDDKAQIHSSVIIGPYSVVGPNVVLEDGCRLESHVVIAGNTRLGSNNHVFPFASIGLQPQDLKYKGEESTLEIGSGNVIREHVTMNPGTGGGGMVTQVGDDCLFMVGAHVAHDCQIGDSVIVTNNVLLAGHVFVEDGAFLSGAVAVHQFCRIGRYAMVGGQAHITQDVPPFVTVDGKTSQIVGLNMVGLRRHGVTGEQLQELKEVYLK